MIKKCVAAAVAALLLALSGCAAAYRPADTPLPSVHYNGAGGRQETNENQDDSGLGDNEGNGEEPGDEDDDDDGGEQAPQEISLKQIVILPKLISKGAIRADNVKYGDNGNSAFFCSFSFITAENKVSSDKDFITVYSAAFKQASLTVNRPFVIDAENLNLKYTTGCNYYLSLMLKNYVLRIDNSYYGESGDAVFNIGFTPSESEIILTDIMAGEVLNSFVSGGIKYDLKLIFD